MKKALLKAHKTKVFGLDSHYLAGGQGKPVFMLHGWGGSKDSWKPLYDALEESGLDFSQYRFYLLDLPGFGESDEPQKGWAVGDYVQWFEQLVQQIYKEDGLKGNFDLIVHSFGGRMLMKMFENGFEHLNGMPQPEKLVMIAAAGIKPTKTLRLRVAAAAAKLGKSVLAWPGLRRLAPLAQKVLYKVLRTHDYEKTSGVMRETFIKVIDEDLRDCLSEIHTPSLIVWGTKDSYLPVKDARVIHEKIAGSELHIINGGRHGIHKTHAKEIAGWIKNFLAK